MGSSRLETAQRNYEVQSFTDISEQTLQDGQRAPLEIRELDVILF